MLQTQAPETPPAPLLDYARPNAVLVLDPRCHAAARLMVSLAILSGLCVAACFAAMFWDIFGAALHVAVFAATLVVAVRSGFLMAASGFVAPAQRMLDLIAAGGLVLICAAPPVVHIFELADGAIRGWGPFVLGLAFLALAATTSRHVMLYRVLRDWAFGTGRYAFGRRLAVLGYIKAVYEAVWLASCAAVLLVMGAGLSDDWVILPAFAAFIGCLGYIPIWVWMISAHARLAAATGS